MTCIDLSKSKVGNCYYAPLVDINGGIINDPLIYKLDENRWRVCIADSDVLLFAKVISSAKNLDPKANAAVAKLNASIMLQCPLLQWWCLLLQGFQNLQKNLLSSLQSKFLQPKPCYLFVLYHIVVMSLQIP